MKSNFAVNGRTHTWLIYIEPWLFLWKREWVEALFFSPEIRRDKFEQEAGKTFFCASDVEKALGDVNPYAAVKRHCRGPLTKREGVVQKVNQYGNAGMEQCGVLPEFKGIAIFRQLFLVALDKIIFRDYNYNSVIYQCYIGGVQNKRKWNDFRKYPTGSESRIFRKRI